MSATMADAVIERIAATFATMNAGVAAADRVSVYNSVIPSAPTSRYAVVYCGPPVLSRGSLDATVGDVYGQFQVTWAATGVAPAGRAEWVARNGSYGLLDTPVNVDGLSPDIYLTHVLSNDPLTVEVVADRLTVEITTIFSYNAARL